MAILDIILLLCFVPAIVSGINKGFVKQVVEFVAILLGAWAAFHFSSSISGWLAQYVKVDTTVLHIISFILTVIVIALILNLLGSLLTRLLKAIALGWLNGILGVLFGILKAGLILGLLIMVFEGLNSSLHLVDPHSLDNAVVYNTLSRFADMVFPYLKEFVTGQ